jgi:hypothetical protein
MTDVAETAAVKRAREAVNQMKKLLSPEHYLFGMGRPDMIEYSSARDELIFAILALDAAWSMPARQDR